MDRNISKEVMKRFFKKLSDSIDADIEQFVKDAVAESATASKTYVMKVNRKWNPAQHLISF